MTTTHSRLTKESGSSTTGRLVERYKQWLADQPMFVSTSQEYDLYLEQATQVANVNGKKIATFTPFRTAHSALRTFTWGQVITLFALAVLIIASLLHFRFEVLTVGIMLIIALYLGHLVLDMIIVTRSIQQTGKEVIDENVIDHLADADWPSYTILCPLYREALVVPQFVRAMRALDYPAEKLQVLFLTEEDDHETRNAIKAMQLPAHFKIVTVPDGSPRTKPRACNYGLMIATGQYIVIYDAEDIPDPLQLKKAVLTFANYGPQLACVQAKLNFYNSSQNLLTRLFTLEYSLWFDLILPGLQKTKLSLPLGGTSNHFRTKVLRALGGWDAFNVTEDCDLGLRLANYRFETAMLDSTTLEEANSQGKNWLRQRSRWIKGYMQTYLVGMRQSFRYLNPQRWREWISLQLLIGGKILTIFINPLMWLLLAAYIFFRPLVEARYHQLFPGPVLYAGVFCLCFGNFFHFYLYLLGCAKRKQYAMVKWAIFVPVYWAMMSIAGGIALTELIFKPHYWQKTKHGLHLQGQHTISITEATAVEAAPDVSNEDTALRLPVALSTLHPSTASSVSPLAEAINGLSPLPAPALSLAQQKALHKTQKAKVKDLWLIATVVIASISSIIACWYFFQQHQILLYDDAYSHLRMARGLIDSATPGLAQLGGVWLPLPHLLLVPLVMNDFLWRSGLAGSLVSMPCYIITAVYIFLAARRFTQNSLASFIGTLTFILNPNILYLQSTPMSELVCIATSTMACYYFLTWIQLERTKYAVLTAACVFLATLARYDGWPLFVTLLVLTGVIGWMKRQPRAQIESNLLIYGLLGGFGIVMWLIWCKSIFGDPLYFQHSTFSAQGQQLDYIRTHALYTYHNLWKALLFYTTDSIDTLGPIVFALTSASVLIFAIRRRFQPEMLAVAVFLLPFAFYVLTLYTGQVIVWVPGAVPADAPRQFFNVRYGAQMVAPAALFIAILVARLPAYVAYITRWNTTVALLRGNGRGLRTKALALILQPAQTTQQKPVARWITQGYVLIVLAILTQSLLIAVGGIITVQDGQYGNSCSLPHPINVYLAQHYAGGQVLEDLYSSKITGADAGLDFHNIIYEGSGVLWQEALSNPGVKVDWIITRPSDKNDMVSHAIDLHSPAFLAQFSLVVAEQDGIYMYHHLGRPTLPIRTVSPYLLSDHRLCGTSH